MQYCVLKYRKITTKCIQLLCGIVHSQFTLYCSSSVVTKVSLGFCVRLHLTHNQRNSDDNDMKRRPRFFKTPNNNKTNWRSFICSTANKKLSSSHCSFAPSLLPLLMRLFNARYLFCLWNSTHNNNNKKTSYQLLCAANLKYFLCGCVCVCMFCSD